jgi:phospholipid transport system substrate-binding protein
MKIKNFFIILVFFSLSLNNLFSMEPDIFVQSTVNRASAILGDNISKEKKIEELKSIANETVDIKGIGFYTLGSFRKTLDDKQKKTYNRLFNNYFLKSFSSRLAEYTNPEIDVYNKEILNKNYTIVNSLLKATNERPEIKIDWRIYTKDPENPLIRDLIIEGLSLARTQKYYLKSLRIFLIIKFHIWWARQDSNLGPIHYECTALTN